MATHTGLSYEDPQQPVGSPRGVSEKQKPTPPSRARELTAAGPALGLSSVLRSACGPEQLAGDGELCPAASACGQPAPQLRND